MLKDIQEEGKLYHMEIWIVQRKQEHQQWLTLWVDIKDVFLVIIFF